MLAFSFLAFACACLCVPVGAQCPLYDHSREILDKAATLLERQSFRSEKHGLGPFEMTFATNVSTAGANPTSLYADAMIGPWSEGNYPEQTLEHIVTSMKSREALVTYLCTPPEALYFSWETYIMIRLSWPPNEVDPGPGAPVSDLMNAFTLRKSHNRSSYSPFNKSIVVITTADARTAAAVQSTLRSLVPPDTEVWLNTINLTASVIHFANTSNSDPLHERPDLFQNVFRVHVKNISKPNIQDYMASRFPMMRVSPMDDHADTPLNTVPEPPVAEGPGNEQGLQVNLDALRNAVVSYMKAKGLELADETGFTAVELDRPRCLSDPSYHPWSNKVTARGCLGTVSDARYSLSDKALPSSTTQPVVVMIGVDHYHMNNTASETILWGTKIAMESAGRLHGSTALFLGDIDDRLFAFTFALNCTDGVAAATQPFCASVAEYPQGGLRYEAYGDPNTGTRPSMGLVQPIALAFTSRRAQ
jgi:hypothetical protein